VYVYLDVLTHKFLTDNGQGLPRLRDFCFWMLFFMSTYLPFCVAVPTLVAAHLLVYISRGVLALLQLLAAGMFFAVDTACRSERPLQDMPQVSRPASTTAQQQRN
jgi:hypothetical protein